MTHAAVSVNEQGRVTIPAQMRRELGFYPSSPLVAYVEDGRLVLEHRNHLAVRMQDEALASRTTTDSVVEELIADRRAEAVREETGLHR